MVTWAAVWLSVVFAAAGLGGAERHPVSVVSASSGTRVLFGRIIAVEKNGGMMVVRRAKRDYFVSLSSGTSVVRGTACLTTADLAPGQAVIVRYITAVDRSLAVHVCVEPTVVSPPTRR